MTSFKKSISARSKQLGLKLVACGVVAIATTACQGDASNHSVLDYVDTRIGTAESIANVTVTQVEEPMGYVSPLVGDPSALTHWTPQTAVYTQKILNIPVPYWYDQERIQGFRGTRYPNGAVVQDWGAMCLMPIVGDVSYDAAERSSAYSHDTEIAKPHYYSVFLEDYKIKCELTAAAKTAIFQFTFPESSNSSILFDGVFIPGTYKVIPEKRQIEGYTSIAGEFRNHFVAEFDKDFDSYSADMLADVVGKELAPNGFDATYYGNDKLQGKPVKTMKYEFLNYDWLKSPSEGVPADFFSARYDADIVARHSGEHTFELTTKDGTRMYFDDELVIDEWGYRSTGVLSYTVNLTKGEKHKLRIEYFDGSAATEMKLRCQEPVTIEDSVAAQRFTQGVDANGVYVSFATKEGEKVKVRVATSLISLEQARKNMAEEIPTFDFEQQVEKRADLWAKELNKIKVVGSQDDMTIFYSALTKCLVGPRNLNEGGRYFSPFDYQVHEGEHMYTDLSLWDTFRSMHPLWVIIRPQESADIINGMLNAYKQGGWLPKWPNPWYRNIMMGTHADAVIADAYVKGIRGFDEELALEAMLKNATTKGDRGFSGRVGIEEFNTIGYVPAGVHGEPVARTLEFSFDDYSIAQMAKAMGKTDKYEEYMQRSKRYLNVLDKETNMIRGKDKDGNWLPAMDKSISVWAQGSDRDTEIYYRNHTLLVPHDVKGLAAFMGGDKELEKFMDNFFAADMYYVGDEFSMHAPFMYNFIGAPYKTQKVVRDMLARYFFNDVGGLPGNDDCGQVSSWYLFGAMGFYPAVPSEPIYQLCSPVMDKVEISVGEGKKFTIIANNNSKENCYIQSATLNGKPYNKSYIHHDDITSGATLELVLGSEPNLNWGLEK